jgi:hypothetical protein
MKPFKAWLLVDDNGTYSPSMYITRREAQAEMEDRIYIEDAKWKIVRVEIRSASTRSKA